MLPGTPMLSYLAASTTTQAYFCPRNFSQARWTRPILPSLSGSIPTKTPPRENNHSFPSAQSSGGGPLGGPTSALSLNDSGATTLLFTLGIAALGLVKVTTRAREADSRGRSKVTVSDLAPLGAF